PQPAGKHFFVGQETFTYGQLGDSVGRALRFFADMGLASGDRIAVATGRDDMLIVLLMAALRAGVSIVMLNPEQTPVELNDQLAWVEPHRLFADGAIASGIDVDRMGAGFSITRIEARRANRGGLLGRFLRPAAPADADPSAIASALQPPAHLPPPY